MTMRTITDFPRNEAGLVDKFIGTAYDIVKYVSDNMGILDFIYNFLNTYGVLLTVDSIDELKATPIAGKYARVYTFSTTAGYGYTDYLYVDNDTSGVIPNDPNATGSWIVVASPTSGGGESGAGVAYIPYVYAQGSALGGETTIAVPSGTVGVPFIINEGYMNTVGYGFTYDVASLTVTLAQPLEQGDEVVLLLTGTPAVPDNPNITDWVQINWLYNGGYAVGGEQVIAIPYTFSAVPAIYKNGLRYYAGLAAQSYTVDAANQRILLTEPLATNDRLIVTIGGESTTLIMSDRTIQEVGRVANVRDSEVILSTNTTQYLNGMKVVYDVVAQKIYGLPTLPTNVYINTVSNGQLTYSPGNITVDLLPVPDSAQELDAQLRAELAAATGSLMSGYGTTNVGNYLTAFSGTLVNVKHPDFGAKGNWNSTTLSGDDDSAAFQAAIDSLTTTYRNGGYRVLYIPTGNYKVSGLILRAALEFGVMFIGDGKYSSIIWGDETAGVPIITSEIEFVHFHGLSLYGSRKQTGTPSDWATCFYKGKLASNAPDIDVTFTNCAIGHAVDFVQAYGRGVVIDPSCVAFFCNYLLNIVCDASTVFVSGHATNAVQTGMRNYNLSPGRTDVVSRMFRVTGTATQKDYINDINILNVNMLSSDLIGEFADATVTQLNVLGVSALNSFSSGLVTGKRLIDATFDVRAKKQYNRDVTSTGYITGLITLTGPFQNLRIRGSFKDLVHHVVQVGALSAGLEIDIAITNVGADGSAFTAVLGGNVVSSDITITATGVAATGACAFFTAGTQTDPKVRCVAYGANFVRPAISYTPNLAIGGTNQTPTFRAGTYKVDNNGIAEVEMAWSYTRVATTTSQVSVSLPLAPAAEYPTLSATISGMATVKFSSYKNALRAELIPASSSVVFYKADGSTLTEADLPSTFTLTLRAVYPTY